jgi:fructose-bisphosphate aldolase class I
MIVDGIGNDKQSSPEVVARKTLKCLLSSVPKEVPGIAFLSGGQSSDLATQHLNLMNENSDNYPWNLTFSYGRALQNDALHGWAGKNRQLAQTLFIDRAQSNSHATRGIFKMKVVN